MIKYQSHYMYLPADASDMTVREQFLAVNCAGVAVDRRKLVNANLRGRNDFYIQYLVQGRLWVDLAGTQTEMHPGDMILYYPHCPYRYEGREDTAYYWVHFSGSEAEKLVKSCGFESHTVYTPGMKQQLCAGFEGLFHDFITRDTYFSLSLAHKLMRLLVDFARAAEVCAPTAPDARIDRIVSYIHNNLDRNLSVEALAASEFISEGYLRVLFQRRFQMSPKRYITLLRIAAARQMLEQTGMSIAEIAAAVGIPDALYFSRLFRSHTGEAPSEYRRSGI